MTKPVFQLWQCRVLDSIAAHFEREDQMAKLKDKDSGTESVMMPTMTPADLKPAETRAPAPEPAVNHTPKAAPRQPRPRREELNVMHRIDCLMGQLPEEAVGRVLAWMFDVWGFDEAGAGERYTTRLQSDNVSRPFEPKVNQPDF